MALLAALGAARTHQQNFALFLTVILGLAVLTVIVFVATETGAAGGINDPR